MICQLNFFWSPVSNEILNGSGYMSKEEKTLYIILLVLVVDNPQVSYVFVNQLTEVADHGGISIRSTVTNLNCTNVKWRRY